VTRKIIVTKRFGTLPSFKNEFEQEAWNNSQYVCGIDEVGRGCLAGPLVTAAVILPINKTSRLLADSKLLTEEERHKGAIWVAKHCWYAYGIVDHTTIDRFNIYHATLIAMKKALIHLLASAPRPSAILIDAMPLKLSDTQYADIPIRFFPKGERKSSSIAAASIIAKVKRDELMDKFENILPGFHFKEHKGYATKLHRDTLKEIPQSIIHRQSFLNSITIAGDQDDLDEQQGIFS
jgi:ribonuclease HII